MGKCRFVRPTVVRLPLSDGDYIDVKHELTAGEQRRVFSSLIKEMHAGEPAVLDPALVGKTQLLEYIVGWSFVGQDGEPAPFSAAALDTLDTNTYEELVAAVQAHDAASEAARAARKNGRAGETPSSGISPLPSAAAGESSGSVN